MISEGKVKPGGNPNVAKGDSSCANRLGGPEKL
jgi:hypothetical protein